MKVAHSAYSSDVFINCPFDTEYNPLFETMIFTIFDCGFRPRCAKEIVSSGKPRIDELLRIIRDCKYGIHDVSRVQVEGDTGLPRFNMPFEYGLFMGASHFGEQRQRLKQCVVLDSEPYRYQESISDISGQNVRCHKNSSDVLVAVVRDWLRASSGRKTLPGGRAVQERWLRFREQLPAVCDELGLDRDCLEYADYTQLVSEWICQHPAVVPSPR